MRDLHSRGHMSLIFTDDFLQKVGNSSNHFEREYVRFLAKNPKMATLRQQLEDIIVNYPEAKRNEMITNLRSFDDIQCQSRISELIIFDKLAKVFHDLEVEPVLAEVDGRTPDFWIPGRVAIELFTIFDKTNPHEDSIIETLNTIRSSVKIIMLSIKNIGDDSPKMGEIRDYFIKLFEQKEGITALEPFYYKTNQGIIISGFLHKGNVDHPTVSGVWSTYGSTEGDPDYKKIVRGRIKGKLKKYKKLVNSNIPIVVIIANRNTWIDEKDYDEILFGDEQFNFNPNDVSNFWVTRTDVFLRRDQHTSLSAVLIEDNTNYGTYFLIENPFARVNVDSIRSEIRSAFPTKELNVSRA